MCQPKPGTRCASHVSKELVKAEKEYSKNPSLENFHTIDKLKKDYDSTPTGQKALAAEIVELDTQIKQNKKNVGKSLEREILSQRLNAGIELRKNQKELLLRDRIASYEKRTSQTSSSNKASSGSTNESYVEKAGQNTADTLVLSAAWGTRRTSSTKVITQAEAIASIEKHKKDAAEHQRKFLEDVRNRNGIAVPKATTPAPIPRRIGNRLSLVTDQDVKGLSPESIEKVSNPKNEFYARAYRMQVDKFQNGDGQEEVSFSLSVGKKYNDHIVRCISHARSLGAKVEVTSSSGLFKTSWGFNATGPSSAVSGFLLNIGPIMGSTVDE